tara:strand:- start:505 stop:1434 length:930 start_codon:yes stop_codon:yes gene_type:complete
MKNNDKSDSSNIFSECSGVSSIVKNVKDINSPTASVTPSSHSIASSSSVFSSATSVTPSSSHSTASSSSHSTAASVTPSSVFSNASSSSQSDAPSSSQTAASSSIFQYSSNTTIDEPKIFEINKKKICIDVAVISHEYTNIIADVCEDHTLNLDDIPVTIEMFQSLFYPYKENFGIARDYLLNNKELLPLISFLPEFRSIDNKRFFLLEELIANIESDLGISRNCFTKESLVELTNEITNLKNLLHLKCCSVLASLTWSNVLEIIDNYKLTKCGDIDIIPILAVNVVFKTPTPGVKNTIVRFLYKISNM